MVAHRWHSIANCPACNSRSYVKSTRYHKTDSGEVRRRRECIECKRRWTTVEISSDDADEMLPATASKIKRMLGLILSGHNGIKKLTEDRP